MMTDNGTKFIKKSLPAATIWLTRPQNQVAGIRRQLEQTGCRVLHLPMLEIVALPCDTTIKSRLMDLDHYQLIFFVSTNAATLGMESISQYWPQYPAGLMNFAVGPGTARVLENYGLEVFYPVQNMNSEALLALPQLEQIEGKKALIIRGVGGREVLAEGLRSQGAQVDYLELYRRDIPQYSPEYLRQCMNNFAPDAVVISSAEALQNFVTIMQPHWSALQHKVQFFVASQRLSDQA
ncbi:MAG: uroporphyrinogen-III synthase, partial [Pseudohongiellaceae bacterium]